jgi:peptidyl-tRNA hydrolase, PTH1 family
VNLIVGLGNPGKKYQNTRHNFGFRVIDEYASKYNLQFKAGKGDYVFAKEGQLMLVKPTTYMNNSGVAVKSICNYYDISAENITVVYDDIDIPLGNIRIRPQGRPGGHRGVESVIYHLESDVFTRIKLGIASDMNMRPAEKYVLSNFRSEDENIVKEVTSSACDALEYFQSHSIEETMNKFNKKEKE